MAKESESVTAERAKEALDYDPETGILTWRVTLNQHAREGTSAGSKRNYDKNGDLQYVCVGLDGKKYTAHRLAWLINYGRWPVGDIDHINGDGLDNRLANLREVPRFQNLRNASRQRNNTSGVTGVYWETQSKQWHAQIKSHGKVKFLGRFNTLDEATAARKKAEAEFGFHPNHGLPREVRASFAQVD